MKKILTFLLAVVMVVTAIPFGTLHVSAEDDGNEKLTFTVVGGTAIVGKTATVDIVVSNNTGFAGATLEVGYNSSVMTLKGYEPSSWEPTSNFDENPTKNPVAFSWVRTKNYTANTTFLSLTFEIKNNAREGDYSITLASEFGVFDQNQKAVDFALVGGKISVKTYIPGDTTGDSIVNAADAVLLAQYLAKWDIDINLDPCDCNGDGTVNAADAVLLAQYLAKWDVTLVGPERPGCSHASLTAVEAKPATCTEDGHIAYWHCLDCEKYFSDANAETEITIADTVIAGGHTYATVLVYDQVSHWYAATCEHSNLVKDKSAHVFGDDKICDVCLFDGNYMYKLATPQAVAVKYDIVSWTAVPNASSYTVVVNGDYEYVTKNNECSLTSVKNATGERLFDDRTGISKHGQIKVVVYANDNGEYTRSDESKAVVYYYVPDGGETQSDKRSKAESYGLGLGYNMVDTGFYTGMQPGKAVFDIGKLLSVDTLTEPSLGSGGESTSYYYTSIDDYVDQYAENSKINVSIGGGATGSVAAGLKTDLSYGSSTNYTSHKYYCSYVCRTDAYSGIVNFGGQNSDIKIHCLSQQFLQDLRRESNDTKLLSEAELCAYMYRTYGTHVALGIVKGGYFVTSYSVWTDSVEDMSSVEATFIGAVNANVGTFFNASCDVTEQGKNTIKITHESTTSLLKSSYYGGKVNVSGDKAAITNWALNKGVDDVPLYFADNGAIAISSLIAAFEQTYGNLGTNGTSLGAYYGKYVDERADTVYHELYDKYTYEPPFDVEVVKEEGKNVLVIDLSMYQYDGELDAAGCSYFVDGIFNVYPNMLGQDIDTVRLVGAMDKTNTDKQLLDGFSLVLKGKWTEDVEIILENFGVAAKSDYGIVDSTDIPKSTNVTIRYEGINILKETTGIYYCYVEHGDTSCCFVLSDDDVPTWEFSNVSIDGDIIYLPIAKKANYAFAGWFDGQGNKIADQLGALDTTRKYDTDIETIRVNWNANVYTITLNNMGAKVPGTEKIYLMYGVGYAESSPDNEKFEQLSKITIPFKKGYIFDGYYTHPDVNANRNVAEVSGEVQYIDANGVIKNVIGEGVPANMAFKDNVILYAKWSPVTYTVEYYAKSDSAEDKVVGGIVNNEIHTYSDGQTFTPAVNGFTCAGKSFVCWNTEEDGSGTDYFVGELYNSLSDTNGATVKLYAKWTDNIVIILKSDGSENSYTNAIYLTPEKNAIYGDENCTHPITSISIPMITGYTFGGFYESISNNKTVGATGQNMWIDKYGNIVGNPSDHTYGLVLVALWIENEYTVQYNANPPGASSNVKNMPNPDKITCQYNVSFTLANAPKLTGWTFGGWYSYPDCTYKIGNPGEKTSRLTSKPNGEVNLYAKWTANIYTVTYNANGGTIGTGTENKIYDSNYGTLPTPTRLNCTFAGWYLGDEKIESTTKVTTAGDHILVARWVPMTSGYWTTGDRDVNVSTSGRTEYWQTGLNRDALKAAGYTQFTIKIKMAGIFDSGDWFKADWWFEIYDPSGNMIVEENEGHWDTEWETREYSYTINLDTIRDDGTILVWYDHSGDGADDFRLGKLEIWTTAK